MLRKNLYFIHHFDTKMDYSLHYSLFDIEDHDKIHLNDSVLHKKCNHRLGRWNFFVGNEDHSCAVYHALEIIRQSIFSAKRSNKNSVDIALVPSNVNADKCYVLHFEPRLSSINLEEIKSHSVLPNEHNDNCELENKISKNVFFKVIKPVLEEMFRKQNFKITEKKLKDIEIRNGSNDLNFNRELEVIRIEWSVEKIFNQLNFPSDEIEFKLCA